MDTKLRYTFTPLNGRKPPFSRRKVTSVKIVGCMGITKMTCLTAWIQNIAKAAIPYIVISIIIVRITKYRYRILNREIKTRVGDIVGKVAEEIGICIENSTVSSDFSLHVFVSIPARREGYSSFSLLCSLCVCVDTHADTRNPGHIIKHSIGVIALAAIRASAPISTLPSLRR